MGLSAVAIRIRKVHGSGLPNACVVTQAGRQAGSHRTVIKLRRNSSAHSSELPRMCQEAVPTCNGQISNERCSVTPKVYFMCTAYCC